MRPKRYSSLTNKKDKYLCKHFDKIDINSNYQLYKKILDKGSLTFIELPNLQIETEKIIHEIGYRIRSLSCGLSGKPVRTYKDNENGIGNTTFLIENNLDMSEKSNKKQLIVKSNPEKPMTLIIAPNETKTNGKKLKRTNTLNGETISSPKRKKMDKSDASNEMNEKPSISYEIPNKFWELMEPYCAEINEDHIKTLESMIKSYENDSQYYELPEVNGSSVQSESIVRRYSHSSEFDETNKKHLNGFIDTDNKNGIDLSNFLRKIDSEIRRPLSEIKALHTFPEKVINEISNYDCHEQMKKLRQSICSTSSLTDLCSKPSKSLAKQLKLNNSFKLERHIKKSMEDLGLCNFNLPFITKLETKTNNRCTMQENHRGISKSTEADLVDESLVLQSQDYVEVKLPASAASYSQHGNSSGSRSRANNQSAASAMTKMEVQVKEDKVSVCLKRRQAELKLISESNLGMLRRLLITAKRDLKRQEIERRLACADADVIDAYNIIESYRPTHRTPLKKDRDAAYKALKERQKILKELEMFDSEFII